MPVQETTKNHELKHFISQCRKNSRPESYLLAILHKAQKLWGYLDREVMDTIATEMKIPTAHIWGVATFYHYFNLKPQGKYVVSVCMGTACYVKGAGDILDTLKQELKINIGETSKDMLFTLAEARCLGACGLAPVVMVNDKIYGHLTQKKTVELINNLKAGEKNETH
jgi:NADH-quinone oxidoreductase subunit E